MIKQNAVAFDRAAPDPSAELMQLRESQTLGVLDNHQARIRHIDSHFDYGCRNEQIDFGRLEARHDLGLFTRFHAPVDEANAYLRQLFCELLRRYLRRLTLQHL